MIMIQCYYLVSMKAGWFNIFKLNSNVPIWSYDEEFKKWQRSSKKFIDH